MTSNANSTTASSHLYGASQLSSLYSFITPFNYLLFLTSSLLLFLGYLILPRGIKAQYFGAGRRRRYRRQRTMSSGFGRSYSNGSVMNQGWKQKQLQQKNSQLPSEDLLDNIYAHSHSYAPTLSSPSEITTPTSYGYDVKSEIMSSQVSALQEHVAWSRNDDVSNNSDYKYVEQQTKKQQQQLRLSLPEELKMMLMHPPGVKFIAHGTKCKPRFVWITLHVSLPQSSSSEYHNCLTWRAELKNNKMGNLRKIQLHEILGIELGKRSMALQKLQTNRQVKESDCFSLLTQSGSLDIECISFNTAVNEVNSSLQDNVIATAEEVRAAFITCLALTLMSPSSKGSNTHHPPTTATIAAPSLQSQLERLRKSCRTSSNVPSTVEDQRTIYSGIMSAEISTVSF